MNIYAFIPARFNSSRLPGKPLEDINGKPMIQWVYERSGEAKHVKEAIIATDDERIVKAAEGFGGKCVMTSHEHRSGTDRIAEASKDIDADIIVNIQGDEPLIDPAVIDEAIQPLLDDDSIVMSTVKTRITQKEELSDPNTVKVVTDDNDFALYFSRSQIPYSFDTGKEDAQVAYKHIGLYVYRKDFLVKYAAMELSNLEKTERLEQLRVLQNGYKIKVIETNYNAIAVDTPEDLEKVRSIFKSGIL